MVPTGQASGPPAFVRLAANPLRWQLLTALAEGDIRVRELVTLLDEPQSLVSYHLRQLRDEGLVTAIRSAHDGRDSYYHLDLDRCATAVGETAAALHPSLGKDYAAPLPARRRKRVGGTAVLFVCTGNSARSPIAEALLRHHGAERVSVVSAGTRPKPHLHPNTVRVMHDEFGIDIAGQQTRDIHTLVGRRFDCVVTLCDKAREGCPDFALRPRRVHWSIQDPATTGGSDRASYRVFRQIAADIDSRVRHLLPSLTSTVD